MRILYIDIDSLRPDHLGCYGYHRNTSPNIDSIARDGVLFSRCYTPDAPCLPSRTALYTGRFGIMTGVVGHGGSAADLRIQGANRGFRDWVEQFSLPARLQQAGLHTAQISPFGQRHAARQFYAGFNEIHNTGEGGMESAEVVQPVVMDWLQKNATRDHWFLHINYWDPHTPYRVPLEYPNPFENEPLPEWITPAVLEEHKQMPGPHGALEIGMYTDEVSPDYPRFLGKVENHDDLRRFFDGYDLGVRYADDMIGQIIAHLKELGIYEETAIIVSADHGENLGELGLYAEHGTADEITCHVPLIIKWPGAARGETRNGFHYNLDLAPTLMELLGQKPSACWDGASYAGVLTAGAQDVGRTEVILSQCAHVCQRSVRWDQYLYIRTYHDGYHLFPQEMVFDVESDPHEQNDLALSRPDLCREGLARLCAWHDERMSALATMGHNTDPLWTVMSEGGPYHAHDTTLINTGYLDHLKRTGRGWAIAEYRRRHPRAVPADYPEATTL
jgi:arylsulfatase A-like enzyme